jgi:hypothetical protein
MPNRRCEEWHGAILDDVVDELPDEDAILLEQHLGECQACGLLMERTRAMLDGWSESAAPSQEFSANPVLEEELLRRVRVFERRAGIATPGKRPQMPEPLWRRISWMTLRPIPAYAVAILIVASCLLGIWATATRDHERFVPAGHLPTAADPGTREDIPGPTPERRAPHDRSFTVTPSDALCLIGSLGSDTL